MRISDWSSDVCSSDLDATDQHGFYSGSAAGFIEFAIEALRTTEPGIHQLHNILIEFRPGGALVESYFSAWNQIPGPDGLRNMHQKGRYVDWFEKRGGEWKEIGRASCRERVCQYV